MLKLVRTTASAISSHEDQFLRRYEWLRSWAMKLSHNDADAADDLLQTAFIQFCLRQIDLASIKNIEVYLYTMLRNLRLSQLRLAARAERRTISIGEYDSMEIGLHAVDPAYRLQACVDLSLVCDWACSRKETSKCASVLILRFFHGYQPSEIAPIIGSSARIVGAWLQVARRDLRAHLQADINESHGYEVPAAQRHSAFVDCATTIDDLRARVFSSHQGPCLSESELSQLYGEHSQSISRSRLAHVVSCQACLKRVAMRIDLPNGPDRPQDSSDSSSLTNKATVRSGGQPMLSRLLRRWRRGLQGVLEHSPSGLCLGVDGFIVGVLKVHSEMSEISVEVNLKESTGFLEVFSSQGVQMLLFEATDPTTGGALQTTHVEFAEGRSLTVTVDFTRSKPVVHLRYYDPLFVAAPETLVDDSSEYLPEASFVDVGSSWRQSLWNKWQCALGSWSMPIWQVSIGLCAVLMFLGIWWYAQYTPASVFAAGLLREAAQQEQVGIRAPDIATHRTLRIQESLDGRALAEQHIEIWYSGRQRVKAARIYDDHNHLEAGEWTAASGARTVYRPGAQAKTESPATDSPVTSQEIWRWEPTAKGFTALVSNLVARDVREEAGSWVITYQRTSSSPSTPLVRATLVLDKKQLHATRQTIVLQEVGATREFRFTEDRSERFPIAAVDQAHFIPELELTKAPLAALFASPQLAAAERRLTGTDRDRFEMALTYQLHLLEPCLSEHPSVNVGDDGRLVVGARAKTPQCSRDVARGLAGFAGPTLSNLEVVAVPSTDTPPLTLDEVERIGGYDLFRTYFASRVLDSERARDAIRQEAAWATARSRSVVYHAQALSQLTERWRADSLQQLDPNSVRKWQEMVRAHAIELSREEQVLRRELQPMLFSNLPSPPQAIPQPLNNLSDIAPIVDELVALALRQDETIRSLCTVSEPSASANTLDPTALGPSFDRAVTVASALTRTWPFDP